MATTIQLTQADIDGLATKLDEFAAVLTDRERTVLLGILGMAGKELKEALAQARTPETQPTPDALPPLSAGFRTAFQPGVGAQITFGSEAEKISGELKVSYQR